MIRSWLQRSFFCNTEAPWRTLHLLLLILIQDRVRRCLLKYRLFWLFGFQDWSQIKRFLPLSLHLYHLRLIASIKFIIKCVCFLKISRLRILCHFFKILRLCWALRTINWIISKCKLFPFRNNWLIMSMRVPSKRHKLLRWLLGCKGGMMSIIFIGALFAREARELSCAIKICHWFWDNKIKLPTIMKFDSIDIKTFRTNRLTIW